MRGDFNESFRIGDFSSKHFSRKASVATVESHEYDNVDPDTPNVKRLEGGFEGKTKLNIPQPTFSKTETASALSNLISSVKEDSLLVTNVPPRPESRMSINTDEMSPRKSVPPTPQIDVKNPDPVTVDVVGRHLVSDATSITSSHNDEFDSLQLQGGDISRDLYNWRRSHSPSASQRRRSHSFSGSMNSHNLEPDFNVHDIRVPGGFRRSFLMQKASKRNLLDGEGQSPTFFTRNFIEFLTLYGHFAGEELRDEDDDEEEDEEALDEESLLLPSVNQRKHEETHKATTIKAVMLLLKSFIGTGVLFLPRGFRNAGWLFSVVTLLFFSVMSYWCFMLLINTRSKLSHGSYGDLGGALFGSTMRCSILTSIVLSQIGFAAAYIVFTATNLQAFVSSVFELSYSIEAFIFLQLIIFIPLSLTRKIAKLSGTALVADLFIFLGLIYVYYYCSFITSSRGISSVKSFNKDWTVFIGTAIFTYEGIGLLIPIQESMKNPSKFPVILGWVMFSVTVVFISIGLVGYLAFGEATDTVILLNFPQDSIYVSIVQFLYAMAILLSTPLQLFPAIRILENGIFKRSGKHDKQVKWRKNYFRTFLVIATALFGWAGASNLDKFVSVIGSVACVPLIYIYPPLLHYKLDNTSQFWKKIDLLIAAFGTTMMIYTSFQTVVSWNS
jgi:proton-coupled amino acid transporter